MTISIKPIPCDGLCASCYETKVRRFCREPFDTAAVLARIDAMIEEKKKDQAKHKSHPTIHGGEPLLLPPAELEEILARIHGAWGSTGIQTNAIRLEARHIELFKKYRTSVGISLDGDTGALNWGRWNKAPGTPELAERMTQRTIGQIRDLVKAGIRPSIIAVLRKFNAGPERLTEFERFILRMESEFGIKTIRMNEAIVADPARKAEEELTPAELAAFFERMAPLCFEDPGRVWQPFRDAVDLLTGHPTGTCVFNGCDPWKTGGEQTIMANGSTGGCLKTGAGPDGLQAPQASLYGRERDGLLKTLPQEEGGCRGCRYFPVCHGGCPGAGIEDDWRNRTRFCLAYFRLFDQVESRIHGLLPNYFMPIDMEKPSAEAGLFSIAKSTWQVQHRKPIAAINELARKECPAAAKKAGGYADKPHGDHWDESRQR